MPNELPAFDQEPEKTESPLRRLRRSILPPKENIHPNFVAIQLIELLENMTSQLNRIQLPMGLQRDNPFQSCLDVQTDPTIGNEKFI